MNDFLIDKEDRNSVHQQEFFMEGKKDGGEEGKEGAMIMYGTATFSYQ